MVASFHAESPPQRLAFGVEVWRALEASTGSLAPWLEARGIERGARELAAAAWGSLSPAASLPTATAAGAFAAGADFKLLAEDWLQRQP